MMLYTYLSTRADYNPAKTILVFGPSGKVSTLDDAERWAANSGWRLLAEYEEAVLIVPVIRDGYFELNTTYPGKILSENRNAFQSCCGRSLYQRREAIWCWECLVYLVGYEDGAEYAGNCVVAEPGRFAAAALINGGPTDYRRGDERTTHPLMKEVSDAYQKANREIESRIWLFSGDNDCIRKARDYFGDGKSLTVKNVPEVYDMDLAAEIMTEFFNKTVRWKDGPDGTVTEYPGRVAFYRDGEFLIEKVTIGVTDYPCAVRFPKGLDANAVKGLPLVFSVHGRGEPAWLFATKNGWDTLQDEMRDFVLAVPDSPGNIWQLERDKNVFPALIDCLCSKYSLDRSRVYLTGFSNGAMITREVGSTYPELFAGISPWNGPVHLKEELDHPVYMERLRAEGYEMPAWICAGDKDPAASVDSLREQLEYLLPANGCRFDPAAESVLGYRCDERRTGRNYYREDSGYREGDRFDTSVYVRGRDKEPIVCATIMRDMPHGAIKEQSRACYMFLRRFRREGKQVAIISE